MRKLLTKILLIVVVTAVMAGAEALFPTKNYQKLFEKARKEKIPFTIHAGEADGADSVR